MGAVVPALIGIAFPEPIDARAWSGVPAGLTRGLRACGAEVVHLTGESSGGETMRSPQVARRTGEQIAEAFREAGRLDGIVQIGSTFTLPEGARYVTLEDVTVAQALSILKPPAEWARAWRRRQAEAYARAVACCVATEWAARSVRDDYGVQPARVRVVGLGANLEVERPAAAGYESPRFLFVGRGWERKNGPAVLRAFESIRNEFPDATLDLVSEHPPVDDVGIRGHGPLPVEREPQQEAERRAFLRDLFARATCFVMPSRFEPFGIVYLEAGTAGVASIGTSVGGAADVIGTGGLVVDPADDTALRKAMAALCVPQTAERLGSLARRNAAWYRWSLVARRVLDALLC